MIRVRSMASIHHCSVTPREEVPDDHSYIDDLRPLDLDDEAVKERFDSCSQSKIIKPNEVTTLE